MTQETQKPKVSIQNLTKYFGTKLILHSVNLDVQLHEVVCLIGASGSGKSTLLRALAGLQEKEALEIVKHWGSLFGKNLQRALEPLRGGK